jgi:hypothetical protein
VNHGLAINWALRLVALHGEEQSRLQPGPKGVSRERYHLAGGDGESAFGMSRMRPIEVGKAAQATRAGRE